VPVPSILAAVVLITCPLSPSAIAELLDKEIDEDLQSLLALYESLVADPTSCLGKMLFISFRNNYVELCGISP